MNSNINKILLNKETSYFDPNSGCHFIITTPTKRPDLWEIYLASALEKYYQYDVLKALNYDAIRDGKSTSLFFIAMEPDGRAVGGVRVQGPYTNAEDAHVLTEWEGSPAQGAIRDSIIERLPFGIIECKSAWVSDLATNRHIMSVSLARTSIHAMKILGARFSIASAAKYVIDIWRTTGALIAEEATPLHYPDKRYLTSMAWWDLNTISEHASPEQLPMITSEYDELSGGLNQEIIKNNFCWGALDTIKSAAILT